MKRNAKKDSKIDSQGNSMEDEIQVAKWNTKKKASLGRGLLTFGIILIAIVAIVAIIYFVLIKKEEAEDTTYTANITVGTNQELLVGQITGINGNEIDFDIVEETTFEMGQAGSEGGERPSGGFSKGEPSTGETSTGKTQGETISGNRIMPEVNANETVAEAITIYQSTGETKSLQIPVGTEVVTKLGNITTFSRLAVGDVVNLLIEKADDGDTIVKIWIVG